MQEQNQEVIEKNKKRIIEALLSVERPGVQELIAFLEQSDYFNAPASINWHGNYPGGLAQHGIGVYDLFKERCKNTQVKIGDDTIIICAYLHDLCKVGLYKKSYEFLKGEFTGKVTYGYNVSHPARVRHSSVSLSVIEKFIKLTPLEREIIKYHMGLFGAFGKFKEYEPEEMYVAIKNSYLVQVFASCDTEEAHSVWDSV